MGRRKKKKRRRRRRLDGGAGVGIGSMTHNRWQDEEIPSLTKMQTNVLSYPGLIFRSFGNKKKKKRYGDFIKPAFFILPPPDKRFIPPFRRRRTRALSLLHPTWHVARSDVLYILINREQHLSGSRSCVCMYTEMYCHMHLLTCKHPTRLLHLHAFKEPLVY